MVKSWKVATTLAAYRCVAVTGNHLVGYPADAQMLPIGITQNSVRVVNEAIPVYGPGERAMLYFNDTVTSGDYVASDSSGRGVKFTPGQNTTTAYTTTSGFVTGAYVGILCGPTIGLTGTLAEVFIVPGLARGV